jgi:diguanylate cyclase (GGDEF)-like protein
MHLLGRRSGDEPSRTLSRSGGALVGGVMGAGIVAGWLSPGVLGASWVVNALVLTVASAVVGFLFARTRTVDARLLEVLEAQRQQALLAAEEKSELSLELSRRVNEDVLTGLANRSAFVEALGQRISEGTKLAVLFVDLDDFKTVNDTLGHAVGDELLASVAERLTHGSRGHDMVARFGGDEFAILLCDLSPTDALHVGQRMLGQLKTPFNLCGRTITVKASGGLAVSGGEHYADSEERALELMRQADLAMYTNKAQHQPGITLFHDGMQSEMMERLSLESDLHRALGTNELDVAYQPIVDLRTDSLVGVEALLRWAHPTRGPISPAAFIPVAEQTGMIVPLTLWVVRRACAQLRSWDDDERTRGLCVSVNISARLVSEPGIASAIARELYYAGIDPYRIVLEITESLLMDDERSQAVQTLCQLRAVGMRLSVDDFGTGYSSLSRLNTLPIDEVKIDQSFVAQINQTGSGDTIVRATVAMAHGLGLRVVAEGVESAAQLAALRDVGCDEAQGYLFGRPVRADQVPVLVEHRRSGGGGAVIRALPVQRTDVDVQEDVV